METIIKTIIMAVTLVALYVQIHFVKKDSKYIYEELEKIKKMGE